MQSSLLGLSRGEIDGERHVFGTFRAESMGDVSFGKLNGENDIEPNEGDDISAHDIFGERCRALHVPPCCVPCGDALDFGDCLPADAASLAAFLSSHFAWLGETPGLRKGDDDTERDGFPLLFTGVLHSPAGGLLLLLPRDAPGVGFCCSSCELTASCGCGRSEGDTEAREAFCISSPSPGELSDLAGAAVPGKTGMPATSPPSAYCRLGDDDGVLFFFFSLLCLCHHALGMASWTAVGGRFPSFFVVCPELAEDSQIQKRAR